MVHEYLNDFNNLGWKIHLPVVDSTDNQLTKDICDFLNKKFGITTSLTMSSGKVQKNTFSAYKVGGGGHLHDGSGMTIYGLTHTQEEIFDLAKEIDEKFGARILETRKQYGINLRPEYKISDAVTARFVVKDQIKMTDYTAHKGFGQSTPTIAIQTQGQDLVVKHGNSIKRVPGMLYLKENDIFPAWVKNNKLLQNEYNAGASMLECIDSFGELVTGKMKNEIPQPILDAFGPNFLRENPDLLKTLPERVQKGNENFAKLLFQYIGEGPKSKGGRIVDLSTEITIKLKHVLSMDEKTIKTALVTLSKESPEKFKFIQQNLDDLILKVPDLKVLKTPSFICIFNSAANINHNKSLSWVDDIYAKFKAPKATPIATPSAVTTVNKQQTLAKQIVNSLTSKGGTVGLCIAGVSLLTLGAVSIFSQSNNNNLVASNQVTKRENSCQTNIFKNRGNLTV